MDFKTLAPTIAAVGTAATTVAAGLPEPAAMVARIVGASLAFAADLAAAGVDPVTHIQRVHAHEAKLADVESAWREALRKKFGGGA